MESQHPENAGGLGYYFNADPSAVEAEKSAKNVMLEEQQLAYPLSGAEVPVAGYPVMMGEALTPVMLDRARPIGGRHARRAERTREYRSEWRSNRREYRIERRLARLERVGAIVTGLIKAVKSKKLKD